jgi:acylphosphatase
MRVKAMLAALVGKTARRRSLVMVACIRLSLAALALLGPCEGGKRCQTPFRAAEAATGPASAQASAEQRMEVLFRGNVQGVGFRYTTLQTARRFRVAGFVRNLPDGQVRVVAEGDAEELDAFLAAVERAMADHISGRDVRRSAASGEFVGFEIR